MLFPFPFLTGLFINTVAISLRRLVDCTFIMKITHRVYQKEWKCARMEHHALQEAKF